MKLKEKLRQCYQILFKGKVLTKEMQEAEKECRAKMREAEELAERLKKQLEFLINSARPVMLADANSMMGVQKTAVHTVGISALDGLLPYSPFREVHYMDMHKVNGRYKIEESPDKIADRIDMYYKMVAHNFAELLIKNKLIRVDVIHSPEDVHLFELRFEALFYKNKEKIL